jgi:hypothetical protein
MTLAVTPSQRSNRVVVTVIHPQALAGLRLPEPDITRAGKESSLVRMTGQILHVTIHYLQAACRADLPESDRPVPAT